MAKAPAQKKGDVGKNTGSSVRKHINKAQGKGLSNAEIGRKTNRSASTISKIDNGTIKNPPKSLVAKVQKAASGKSKK